jgi:tricorn protease
MIRYLVLAAATAAAMWAQTRLLRHPTYHQGQVTFVFQGDLWTAKDDGTNVRRLTTHKARESYPRYSPDGKWIAFSSNRFGNDDVFLMPAEGGPARQLTYHSGGDTVVGWTPDGKRVLFSAMRGDGAFPMVANLYEVPLDGGGERLVKTDWGAWGSYAPDGKKLAVMRRPGTWWRKHYRGAAAADVWLMDTASGQFTPLTDPDYKGNMLWPQYGARGEIYFVADRLPNEKNVAFGGPEVMKSVNNLWRVSERGGKPEQVTKHTSGSLFFPAISADGKTIVYEENFGLWKLDTASGRTAEIKINLPADEKDNEIEWKTLTSTADSYSLSPSGRRAAVSGHGEIFTIATDRGETQRVTRSFRRDTSPVWSPNGKWIAYVSDETGREEVWVADELGKQRKRITNSDTEKRGMSWAPDSKSLLVSASDNKLWRVDVETGDGKVVTQSDVGPVNSAFFSPDGQWIAYVKTDRDSRPHAFVMPAAGGVEKQIGEDDLFAATAVRWTPDGKHLLLTAGVMQMGMASLGRTSSLQLYALALTKQDKDPLDRGIDTEEEAAAQAPAPPAGGGPRTPNANAKVEVKIDFDGWAKRLRQLTRLADNVTSFVPSPDSRSAAFVASGQQDGRFNAALWTVQLTGEGLTRVAQAQPPMGEDDGGPRGMGRGGFGGLISQPQYARDGRTLYFLEGDGLYSVPVPAADSGPGGGGGGAFRGLPMVAAGPAPTPQRRRIPFTLRVEVDRAQQRAQVFDEGWRIMKHRFYDANMHGVNWSQVKDTYASLLKHISEPDDLHGLMRQMIGELNASHTGVTGAPDPEMRSMPRTRFPGFEVDSDSSGFKVRFVYAKGPADKDFIKLAPGHYLLAVNGVDLKPGDNLWQHYTRSTARRWEFLVNSEPKREGAWTVEIEPVSEQQQMNLAYEKWVNDRKKMVEKLSNGEIGYLHIRAMDAPSFRRFELDLADNRFKKALIIDQRFNGGGGIDQELLQVLGQRAYQTIRRRDSVEQVRPQRAFFGPMVVMQNERSGSDAEMFPDGFRTLGLGKLVGVPTAGAVIGTGAYTLMDGASIRTPGVGVYTAKGANMENYGVPPDVYVDNPPAETVKGRDIQIEKAIEVLRADLAKKK